MIDEQHSMVPFWTATRRDGSHSAHCSVSLHLGTYSTFRSSIPVSSQGNIGVFSESGSGCVQGAPCREWPVLPKRRNTTHDRFPIRPKGANQMIQYSVTVLNKDVPLFANCASSRIIWLALNMSILPWKDTHIEQNELPSQ